MLTHSAYHECLFFPTKARNRYRDLQVKINYFTTRNMDMFVMYSNLAMTGLLSMAQISCEKDESIKVLNANSFYVFLCGRVLSFL